MNEIKSIRSESGLSQRAFAESLGIPLRTLQQWEQCAQNPPAYVEEMIKRVSRYRNLIKEFPTIENTAIGERNWKTCIDKPFTNCSRVYPIQQRKVKSIIDAVINDDRVIEIVIFGSSVTSSCHIDSDVDVFMKTSEDYNPLNAAGYIADFEYDLFTNYMVDDRLMNEIRKKGVVVFERSGDKHGGLAI